MTDPTLVSTFPFANVLSITSRRGTGGAPDRIWAGSGGSLRMRVLSFFALFCFLSAEATGQLLAGGDRVYTHDGTFANGRLGIGVAAIGDADGDGVPDYVASEWLTSRIYLYSGRTGEILITATPAGAIAKSQPMAAIGDVNDDGVIDFAVASDFGTSMSNPVAVISGKTLQTLYTITKPGATWTFGHSLCGIMDVDGDAVRDLAIGEYFGWHESYAFIGGGLVHIYSGKTGKYLWTFHGPGEVPYQGMGYGLADAGDFDGDGFGDIAVGTQTAFTHPGFARIVSGRTGEVLLHVQAQNSVGSYATAVLVPGDLDGDGVPDLVVAHPGLGPGGHVYAHSGKDGALLWAHAGTPGASRFGHVLVAGGDLDGDGVPDVMGGTFDINIASSPGYVRALSGATGELLLHFDSGLGDPGGKGFGSTLDLVGDVNGDGIPEVVIGARNWTASAEWAGRVQLFSLGLRSLRPDTTTLSLGAGGVQQLRLRPGPEWADTIYVLAGSATGIVPGLPLGEHVLPLIFDSYTTSSLGGLGGLLGPVIGVTSSTGTGLVTLTVPAGAPPALAGLSLQHAYALIDPAHGVVFTSNAAPVTFLP